MECVNFHGLVLLQVVYNTLSKITDRQMETHTEEVAAHYWVRFRKHRSTNDLVICYDTNITEILQEKQMST